ncbi:gas vesicle protein GvpO [Streptomyces sp. NPDC001634]|uniref:gas vesicle protein GvpO n=1 Tax=Streptomyces sp. NPDC001634 TaxID=3154390 RepID=UPI00332C18C3
MTSDREREKARPSPRKAPSERERNAPPERESQALTERVPAVEAMRSAAGQLAELLGRVPQSVSALRPTDDGWEAEVEVVELERVPDTSSVMASYKVVLDPVGRLMAYERVRRYTRAQVDREGR